MHTLSSTLHLRREHSYGNGITYHDEVMLDAKQQSPGVFVTPALDRDTQSLSAYFTRVGDKHKYGYFPNVLANLYTISHHNYNHPDFRGIWSLSAVGDPEAFTAFEHLWANSVGTDGYLYNALSDIPVPTWESQDYIGGFDNRSYDLDKVLARLLTISWVRNASIQPIPYYNRDGDRTHGIRYEYLIPETLFTKLWKAKKGDEFVSCRIKDQFRAGSKLDPFGVEKFRLPEPKDYDDPDRS